jgi:D-alanyl-lipoteichoic acid acyltransferase DltB (MBOAT superfamily)
MMLLAASYYFYMCWRVEFIVLIIISTLTDYWVGLQMVKHKEKSKRKKYLWISLIINLGLLFSFKYFNFFSYNTELLLAEFNIFYDSPVFNVLLPVGISFYTFQTLSYTIDVYKGKAPAEKHLGYFALYVAYFPQLVAGPIERSTRLLPQLKKEQKISKENFRYGINKILLGFFKKVVVADTVSIYIDEMYGHIPNGTGMQYYFVIILFGAQLFADFSGYTDIAIGSARLMGVNLMENFDKPLWSRNLSLFWSRWHISLTSWIRDYLWIPLALRYRKAGFFITAFILTLIGLWHGASWNFIIFGMSHGIIMGIQNRYKKIKLLKPINESKIGHIFLCLWTYNLMAFTAIFFRTKTPSDAWSVVTHIFTDFRFGIEEFSSPHQTQFIISAFVSILLIITVAFNKALKFKYNWMYVTSMIIVIILLGRDLKNQFIYFQF